MVIAVMVLALAGCAGVHLSPPETTGSVTSLVSGTLNYAGSDHADWEAIRDRAVTVPQATAVDRIEWTNDATGNSGTITGLTAVDAGKGQPCRRLSTTIAAADGVRLFSAELCKSVMETWEFGKIAPAETPVDTPADTKVAAQPPVRPEASPGPRLGKRG